MCALILAAFIAGAAADATELMINQSVAIATQNTAVPQ